MVNKGFNFQLGLNSNLIRAFHDPLRQILPKFDVLKRRLRPLNRAVADAATARRLRDADASSQQLADALLDRVADLGRPSCSLAPRLDASRRLGLSMFFPHFAGVAKAQRSRRLRSLAGEIC